MDTFDIMLDRIDFIKGNIIADERSDALQQLKELRQLIEDEQEKQRNCKLP